ncbi:DeoR/GlpR family DNA-binding transcription regulator [Enterococcus sp. LJL98]
MSKEARLKQITELIQEKKRIRHEDLVKITFSSISTLRRDLIDLEKKGVLKRHRGEIVLNNFNTLEPTHQIREHEQLEQKKLIANLAKDFIGPGMCVYLDSSTTVCELCPYLADIEHLIVITNGLNTAHLLSQYANPSMQIFITSGEVQHQSPSIINIDLESSLINHFNIDLAICSARGIDANGVYEASLGQAYSKKRILDKAKETLLLIDSSKFSKNSFFKINDLHSYKAIISDELPIKSILNTVEKLDIEWIAK